LNHFFDSLLYRIWSLDLTIATPVIIGCFNLFCKAQHLKGIAMSHQIAAQETYCQKNFSYNAFIFYLKDLPGGARKTSISAYI